MGTCIFSRKFINLHTCYIYLHTQILANLYTCIHTYMHTCILAICIPAFIKSRTFHRIRYHFSEYGVPPNSALFGGTVPPNSVLFGGTVPPNSVLFGGTVPPNSFPLLELHHPLRNCQ